MSPLSLGPGDVAELLDWKRHVFQIYWQVRRMVDREEAWRLWKVARDALFYGHAQSPLGPDARKRFERVAGLPYFDYDPAARVEAVVEPAKPEHYDIATSGDDTYGFTRFGRARFELYGNESTLELYWLDGYGGGLFLPFRDGTSGTETYGAGRYLLDTVKGADLGTTGDGKLVLDFNFAYNPSCAYDPKWVCPLAPPPNRLKIRIEAGERYENEG
jgi:uncharacterized protein (DUF1684 family)